MADRGRIAILVDDMFFAAKIRAAAQNAAREVESVKSLDQLEKMVDDPPAMVILDLNSERLDGIAAIKVLKSKPTMKGIPIVGFLSHVQVDLKQAAESAGCDYVIPRSMFSMKLPEIAGGDLSSLPKNG
jgi:CheY-like chemotaxis protein